MAGWEGLRWACKNGRPPRFHRLVLWFRPDPACHPRQCRWMCSCIPVPPNGGNWHQQGGPILILLGALVAARIAWKTLNRSLDSDKYTEALGIDTLEVLAKSKLAKEEELELFDTAWEAVSGGRASGGALQQEADSPLEFVVLDPEGPILALHEQPTRAPAPVLGSWRPRPSMHRWARQRRPSASADRTPLTRDNEGNSKRNIGRKADEE